MSRMKFCFTLLVLLTAVNVAVGQGFGENVSNFFVKVWSAIENFIGMVKVFFDRITGVANQRILNSLNNVVLELETSGLTEMAEKLNQTAVHKIGVLKNQLKLNDFNNEINNAWKFMEKAFMEKIQEDVMELAAAIEGSPGTDHCWEDKSEDAESIFEDLITKVGDLVAEEVLSFGSKVNTLTIQMESDIEQITSSLDDRSKQEIMRFVS